MKFVFICFSFFVSIYFGKAAKTSLTKDYARNISPTTSCTEVNQSDRKIPQNNSDTKSCFYCWQLHNFYFHFHCTQTSFHGDSLITSVWNLFRSTNFCLLFGTYHKVVFPVLVSPFRISKQRLFGKEVYMECKMTVIRQTLLYLSCTVSFQKVEDNGSPQLLVLCSNFCPITVPPSPALLPI